MKKKNKQTNNPIKISVENLNRHLCKEDIKVPKDTWKDVQLSLLEKC